MSPEELKDSELLARFVFFPDHFRSDGSVKSNAFHPPPDNEMSVTRHASLKDEEIWDRGKAVAEQRRMPLVGRADVEVGIVRKAALQVRKDPLDADPEHALITGWNPKPQLKAQALFLAENCRGLRWDTTKTS